MVYHHITLNTFYITHQTREGQAQLLLGQEIACEYQVPQAPKAWLESARDALETGCDVKGI